MFGVKPTDGQCKAKGRVRPISVSGFPPSIAVTATPSLGNSQRAWGFQTRLWSLCLGRNRGHEGELELEKDRGDKGHAARGCDRRGKRERERDTPPLDAPVCRSYIHNKY